MDKYVQYICAAHCIQEFINVTANLGICFELVEMQGLHPCQCGRLCRIVSERPRARWIHNLERLTLTSDDVVLFGESAQTYMVALHQYSADFGHK